MKIRQKKSYALILLAFLVAVFVALGMVTETCYLLFTKESVQEIRSERAYYACIAGLRYASLALPIILAQSPPPTFPYTVTGGELGGIFFNDLNLGTMVLTITIDTTATPGSYRVTASCTY